MKNLSINLNTFNFIERESVNGKKMKNKCGRDFLYYAFTYYLPKKFNSQINNPVLIDKNHLFGYPIHPDFSWTMIQFYKIPSLLKNLGLSLVINDRKIRNFLNFLILIIIPKKKTVGEAIDEIEKVIDEGNVVGIDIPVGFFGLYNHIMFVYGYDEENLYIFDTQKIPILEYEKITEDYKYIMRLPKSIIKEKWGRFGRVWIVKKASTL
ncbi:MAG: hypothetical protein WD991_00465 [Candidatus Paceibacterota bacterium]